MAAFPALLMLPGPAFPAFDFAPPPPPDASPVTVSATEQNECGSLVNPSRRFTMLGRPLYLTSTTLPENSVGHAVHTAASLWDCSLVLAKYFEQLHQKHQLPVSQHTRIVELGLAGFLLRFLLFIYF
jgi:hypothetical protein